MARLLSPLRYPGGKGALGGFLADMIRTNGLHGGTYYELYCGGAGAALHLLVNGVVQQIVINDADFRIHAFWHSILHDTDRFIDAIDNSQLNVVEWQHYKALYKDAENQDIFDVGFATFYLNRTSRSGIIHASGPIGGFNQTGNYLIDVRFNREELKNRIRTIAGFVDHITLTNEDAESFIITHNDELHGDNVFVYLDPPYYHKGRTLYLNNYRHDEHQGLAQLMHNNANLNWIVSYDNVEEIKRLYNPFRMTTFNLRYSLQDKRAGSELMIFSNTLALPCQIRLAGRLQDLDLINHGGDEGL